MTTTCLLADDHPALTWTLAEYLTANGFEVVGPVGDGRQAVAVASSEHPALALVDFRMPHLWGFELIAELRETSPATRLCIYTADADASLARDVIEAGASALVLKEAPLQTVLRALRSVEAGGTYVDPTLAVLLPSGTRLTERELDVLRLLAEGLRQEEIGRRLGIGPETVRTHLRKACARLGAATRTQAVAAALRQGLIA
jgi:two-component system nitrate/nitrite response regulator NarL